MKLFLGTIVVAILLELAQNGHADKPKNLIDCQLTRQIRHERECYSKACVWDSNNPIRCHLITSSVGYLVKDPISDPASPSPLKRDLHLIPGSSGFNSQIQLFEKLSFSFDYLSEKIFRFKIANPNSKRFEVPIQSTFTNPKPLKSVSDAKYQISLKGNFNLTITRKDSQTKLIDTSIGGLLFSDYFLQFSTRLASDKVYGLSAFSRYNKAFRLDLTTYSSDELSTFVWKGMHPFYMVVEPDGKAHGVLLLNSNEIVYDLLPEPAIVWKTIGGIFDFVVFVGDSPEDVIQLYTSYIGRPMMPPFWALGFQLSRDGYRNTSHVKEVIKRNLDNNVPLDVQYVNNNFVDQQRSFTIDSKAFADLPAYINETKTKHHLRWSIDLYPFLKANDTQYQQFSDAYSEDLFIKFPAEIPVKDRRNPPDVPTDRNVVYLKRGGTPFASLDFFKNKTQNWWIDQINKFHSSLQFDAIVINKNGEDPYPEYLGPFKTKFNKNLPYPFENEYLSYDNLCMDALLGDSGQYRYYDVHNLYAVSESVPTVRALQKATGKRGLVVSDMTFVSSGRYTAHSFNGLSRWDILRKSIVNMMKFNLFGINFVGNDICGYSENAYPELCLRWYQLGAYYPFSRSHNDYKSFDQDPAYWKEVGHPEVTEEAVKALRTRYQLLHYLYTRLYRAHVNGETLVRSLMHEYPAIEGAHSINYQFFLGPSIIVSPFVYEKIIGASVDVPPGNWYKFRLSGFLEQITIDSHHKYTFYDAESHRPLLFREGSILPIVANLPTPLNTHQLRQSPIELWILPNSTGFALGDLFWDDGESINSIPDKKYNLYEFSLSHCTISIVPQNIALSTSSDGHLQLHTILIAVQPSKIAHLHSVKARLQSESQTTTELKVSIVDSNHLSIESTLNLFDLLQNKKPIQISFYDQTPSNCFI